MRILVIGSGGREHALVRALSLEQAGLHAAPGNPGIAELAETHPGTAPVPDAILALGAAISVLLVTRSPCHESHQAAGMPRLRPAAFLARIIVPHHE